MVKYINGSRYIVYIGYTMVIKDWRFWLGLYAGLRLCVEACEKCRPGWEERLEKLLSRCEEELDLERLVEGLLEELLGGSGPRNP